MTEYGDRIHHALTFTAKHLDADPAGGATLPWQTRPANLAVLLARCGADETTLIAGVLHQVVESASRNEAPGLRRKIGDKFGSAVLAVAVDAAVEYRDPTGQLLDWRSRAREILARVPLMEPRALDIRCAAEIHECGAALANSRRLGPEYLESGSYASCREAMLWHADLLTALSARPDWSSSLLRRELEAVTSSFGRLAGG